MTTSDEIMEVAEYTVVLPPSLILNDPESIADFCKKVSLQVQGDLAVLNSEIPVEALLVSFAVIYRTATQALLRSADDLVLIFDHETRNLVSNEKVDDSVWLEISKLKDEIVVVGDIALPTFEHIVDLSVFWNETKESDNLIDRTKDFLKKLSENSTPAMTLKLQGSLPSLPLLSAIYLLRPSGHTIQYQNDSGEFLTLFV